MFVSNGEKSRDAGFLFFSNELPCHVTRSIEPQQEQERQESLRFWVADNLESFFKPDTRCQSQSTGKLVQQLLLSSHF